MFLLLLMQAQIADMNASTSSTTAAAALPGSCNLLVTHHQAGFSTRTRQ
jgi:hypothetical protein